MNFNFNIKDMPVVARASIRCVTNARDPHHMAKLGIKRWVQHRKTYGPLPLTAAVERLCVRSTVTELVVLLAAARSGTPSPLKSPTAA